MPADGQPDDESATAGMKPAVYGGAVAVVPASQQRVAQLREHTTGLLDEAGERPGGVAGEGGDGGGLGTMTAHVADDQPPGVLREREQVVEAGSGSCRPPGTRTAALRPGRSVRPRPPRW